MIVQGQNNKWYSYYFKSGDPYYGISFKTLKGIKQTMKNIGNEVVLIMDKNGNRLTESELIQGG